MDIAKYDQTIRLLQEMYDSLTAAEDVYLSREILISLEAVKSTREGLLKILLREAEECSARSDSQEDRIP